MHYGLLFLDLTDAFFYKVSLFCIHFHFCKYTLHVCYVFNVNLTDSFDDRQSQCRLSSDRAAPTDTNPKSLELALPQSLTATRLDQLVYSPNYYIQIFRLNLLPTVRIEPSTACSKLKSNVLTDCAMGASLKLTNVKDLYLLARIAPPEIRRDVCAGMEKIRQETNEAHPAERRLKCRNCFLRSVKRAEFSPKVIQCNEWQRI